ncbi:MAG: hypothetical protein KA184_21015 [Candidatus Hydrogenedentes bacterium]|nr:hypothetical protein [Candidatus Hydrogenedentota bacterium]
MRRASVMMAAAACLLGVCGQVWAADTDTITVTVSLEAVISVSVSPNTWNIGAIALSGTNGPQSFTATVGNSATKLEIMGSNGAGGWTIGATPGADRFVVAVTSPAITLTTAYQTLEASVAAYGSKGFDLTYSAPVSDTKGGGVDQSCVVTLKASAP